MRYGSEALFGPYTRRVETWYTGLQIGHKMIVVQWQNGKKVIVWPPEAATGELIYPAPNWWSRE